MRTIRARLHVATGDEGMTLVEVMVAMFVFAILSTMVLSSLLQVVTTNRNSQARHAAANLAASEIDRVHAAADVFRLVDEAYEEVVNNTVFNVVRETAWFSDSATGEACGVGGRLLYKQVNVTVTWELGGIGRVTADTIVNPAEPAHDPSRGTVRVSIVDGAGAGVAGVEVKLVSGGTSVTATSDARGCAYLLRVPPGTYELSASKSGHIVLPQDGEDAPVLVQAATTANREFQIERSATVDVRLAANAVGAVLLPRDLPLSLYRDLGATELPFTDRPDTITSRAVEVYPDRYRVFAGGYREQPGSTCVAANPERWLADTGASLTAGTAPVVDAQPGGDAAVDVPMGLVLVEEYSASLIASSRSGRTGDPKCDRAAIEYRFDNVARGSVIALPFGSWEITRDRGGWNGRTGVDLQLLTRGTETGAVVSLDPRQPTP